MRLVRAIRQSLCRRALAECLVQRCRGRASGDPAHRPLTGGEAARFLVALKSDLEYT